MSAALTSLEIPHALGGSMASSLLGVPRYTQDADLTAEPFPGRERALAACFGDEHYLSVPAMTEANRLRRSFNIINITSGFKVDVFIRKDRPFELSAMKRRAWIETADAGEPISVHSPEDCILFKLEWHRLGGEVSERQLTDCVGVLRVQAGRLDEDYLERWAAELGVSDLLERVRAQAGSS